MIVHYDNDHPAQSLRLWPGDDGTPWKESVKTSGGDVLLVSQFTLYASCAKAKPNYQYSSAYRVVCLLMSAALTDCLGPTSEHGACGSCV